jgi:hypothetical protein
MSKPFYQMIRLFQQIVIFGKTGFDSSRPLSFMSLIFIVPQVIVEVFQ